MKSIQNKDLKQNEELNKRLKKYEELIKKLKNTKHQSDIESLLRDIEGIDTEGFPPHIIIQASIVILEKNDDLLGQQQQTIIINSIDGFETIEKEIERQQYVAKVYEDFYKISDETLSLEKDIIKGIKNLNKNNINKVEKNIDKLSEKLPQIAEAAEVAIKERENIKAKIDSINKSKNNPKISQQEKKVLNSLLKQQQGKFKQANLVMDEVVKHNEQIQEIKKLTKKGKEKYSKLSNPAEFELYDQLEQKLKNMSGIDDIDNSVKKYKESTKNKDPKFKQLVAETFNEIKSITVNFLKKNYNKLISPAVKQETKQKENNKKEKNLSSSKQIKHERPIRMSNTKGIRPSPTPINPKRVRRTGKQL
ncbi:MAG: hypothetical protein HRU35_02130 [Rickettsiaceae bacterium]|nr:hypothetical protein [Rickettsiaceae bacterium]